MLFKFILKGSKSKTCLLSIYLSLLSCLGFSQDLDTNNELVKPFKAYTQLPRELIYAHLNKSIYIKGKTLAFNAYVFDKNDKGLSQLTTNLYCTISDENGTTLKSKLLKVTSGVSHGSFFIDSLFTSGNYTFKAYTNYIKNFDEHNFYQQSIKVIDPEVESSIIPKVITSALDAQFLPEGGHLVANIENTIGVVIKDNSGFGVPYLKGQLLNSKNEILTIIETNQFGIGRFNFIPKDQDQYKVRINFEDADQVFSLPIADPKGVVFSLRSLNGNVVVRLESNKTTSSQITNEIYKLAIHNGQSLNIIDLYLDSKSTTLKRINFEDLFPGINIFTIFNQDNQPILERLFFNYYGINFLKTDGITYKKSTDSTEVFLSLKEIDTSLTNKFSISILPNDTKSYNHHQNIISATYLQPYVKGYIENASYYFRDISRKKQYELDNLLITQGWSSYDWNNIFNNPPKSDHVFEMGINFKATVNDKDSDSNILLYPTSNSGFETFSMSEGENTFEKLGLYPFDDEKIRLSGIKKNDKVKKVGIYLQFDPSSIPSLDKYTKVLPLKEQVYFDTDLLQPLLESSWTEYEQLDEVVIEVEKEKKRIEELKNTHFGRVDVFNDRTRRMYIDLASYLRTQGYHVTQNAGNIYVTNPIQISLSGDVPPLFYINDRLVVDSGELAYFNMDIVDYIIVNKRGFGEGLRGAGGVIRIYLDPTLAYKDNPQLANFHDFDVPLTFASPTKFYAPKYLYYDSQFYNEYGVIDWFPNKSADENGVISFKISNQGASNNRLFIEGAANKNGFISEIKTLIID